MKKPKLMWATKRGHKVTGIFNTRSQAYCWATEGEHFVRLLVSWSSKTQQKAKP
jgi:hypothetical protein